MGSTTTCGSGWRPPASPCSARLLWAHPRRCAHSRAAQPGCCSPWRPPDDPVASRRWPKRCGAPNGPLAYRPALHVHLGQVRRALDQLGHGARIVRSNGWVRPGDGGLRARCPLGGRPPRWCPGGPGGGSLRRTVARGSRTGPVARARPTPSTTRSSSRPRPIIWKRCGATPKSSGWSCSSSPVTAVPLKRRRCMPWTSSRCANTGGASCSGPGTSPVVRPRRWPPTRTPGSL